MNHNEKLKQMLKDLIPCINGDWVLSDGGLLGIIRNKDLIEHDNDLDLYLYPGSSIDYTKLPQNLSFQNYYMDTKIFDKTNNKVKLNTWNEYLAYKRTISKKKVNRIQHILNCKDTYREEMIIPNFTFPYIDIYHLNDDFTVPNWPDYYFDFDEIKPTLNNDLGFDIYIPSNPEKLLERNYGPDWRIPKADPRKRPPPSS